MNELDVARRLSARVDAAGGSLAIGVRELRDGFGRTRLTDKARWEIEDALGRAGLACQPSLAAVDLEDTVVLYSTSRSQRYPEHGPQTTQWPPPSGPSVKPPWPAPPAASGPGAPAPGVASGVVTAGLLAAAIGFGGYWLYGSIALLVTALVYWLLGRYGAGLHRAMSLRFPLLRSPFLFGAAVLTTAMLVAGIFVMAPIASSRKNDAEHQASTAEPDSGSDIGAAGGSASTSDDDAQKRSDADAAMDEGRYQDAIRIAEDDLGDSALGGRYRRRAARETLAEAQDELDFGSATRAIRLTARADRYYVTTRAKRIRSAARKEIARARARRRQRAYEAPPPSVEAPPDEVPEPAPDIPSGGGGPSCLPSSACPGKRDGDGDGCYCE